MFDIEKWLKTLNRVGGLVVHPYSREAAEMAKKAFDFASQAEWPDKEAKKSFNELYKQAFYGDGKLSCEHWICSIFDDPIPKLCVLEALIIAAGAGTEEMRKLFKVSAYSLRPHIFAESFFEEFVKNKDDLTAKNEYTIESYNSKLLNDEDALLRLYERFCDASALASLAEDDRKTIINLLLYSLIKKYKLKDNSPRPQAAEREKLLPKCLRGHHPVIRLITAYLNSHEPTEKMKVYLKEKGRIGRLNANDVYNIAHISHLKASHANSMPEQRPKRENLYSLIMAMEMSVQDAEIFIAAASGYRFRLYSLADQLFCHYLYQKDFNFSNYNKELLSFTDILTKNAYISTRDISSKLQKAQQIINELGNNAFYSNKIRAMNAEGKQKAIEITAKKLAIKEVLKSSQLGGPIDFVV